MSKKLHKDIEEKQIELGDTPETTRLVHNFFMAGTGGNYNYNDITTIKEFLKYAGTTKEMKQYKVALLFICTGQNYWQYILDAVNGAKQYFLPGHKTDFFLWSDVPDIQGDITVFPTDATDWPLPTLMRYHLFLQQEEKLKEYDYIFYCDIDMRFVNVVGDEILGEGLTAAQHPMYALRKGLQFPLEPNEGSSAYIQQPEFYYAGGFQGGTAKDFITAMKEMRKGIDADFVKNYMARWNDESHWNKYLLTTRPNIVLSPSYVYPDSLIKEYYEKIWGCSYPPKIVTLTKPFTVSKEAGSELAKNLSAPL